MAVATNEFFEHPSDALEVAGVTGTNGKTTTAYRLHAVLDAAGRRPGLLGTVGVLVGAGGRRETFSFGDAPAGRVELDAGRRLV